MVQMTDYGCQTGAYEDRSKIDSNKQGNQKTQVFIKYDFHEVESEITPKVHSGYGVMNFVKTPQEIV